MKVYFYHNENINQMYKEWKSGRYPGHFLYGATHLHKYGVDVVMHRYKNFKSRARLAFYVAWQILTCKEQFDAIYAANTQGLGLVMFLHAIRLYRKPIIAWQKQPITTYDIITKTELKGIDKMLFLSRRLADDTIHSGAILPSQAEIVHWGADLDYYDKLMFFNNEYDNNHQGFISTGKDRRDMATLVRAFSATGHPLQIYIATQAFGDNYLLALNDLRPSSNVKVTFVKGNIPAELAQKVWQSQYVVICLQETNEPIGFTTLIEAMALGLPVICNRNTAYPFDIDEEGIGIGFLYYDSVALEAAIRYIADAPAQAAEMGRKGRKLAEETYNLENCTKEVATLLTQFRPVG